jgi:hypothetical protein
MHVLFQSASHLQRATCGLSLKRLCVSDAMLQAINFSLIVTTTIRLDSRWDGLPQTQSIINLSKPGVAVEKGTKAVISTIFSVCCERTFNNLRTNFSC